MAAIVRGASVVRGQNIQSKCVKLCLHYHFERIFQEAVQSREVILNLHTLFVSEKAFANIELNYFTNEHFVHLF